MTSEHPKPSQQDPAAGGPRPEGPYEAIFTRLPFPAWIADRASLRILAANDAALAYYGYSRQDLLEMSFTDLCRPEDIVDVRQRLGQRAHSRGMTSWFQKRTNGVTVRTRVAWVPVPFQRVPAFFMFHYPSSSAESLEHEAADSRARLEALSSRLVQIQEEERISIARELHDEIGQLLTALKLHLASAGVGKHTETTRIIEELMVWVRDLSMDLRPPMLEETGLVPTLEWYFERYTKRTRVAITFRQDVERMRFQDEIEITAFRIIQEALTNVARHSQTMAVDVELRSDPEGLWIVIEDRGPGFDTSRVRVGSSAGIAGMQERARLVGGHFTLESAVGVGTRIAVVLPLSEPESGRQDLGT